MADEDMSVYSVPQLIAFTSRHVTLRPGDSFLTGTPDGSVSAVVAGYMKLAASPTKWVEASAGHHQRSSNSTYRQVRKQQGASNGWR